MDLIKQGMLKEILNEALIVCATLSVSGWEVLLNLNHPFETVLIDEAAQVNNILAVICPYFNRV